ncbi:MAG: aspartate-semialdehyde dehydrogenase [Oscillochloris sp.]|nr:aspartate-semialdehyde dehydrogenase [Oscillochloris sp.]
MARIPVAVLGATGTVGQRFIQLLEGHPWFEVAAVTGSTRSAGRTYAEATRWVLDRPMPAAVRDMTILGEDADLTTPLVFSALPSKTAGDLESRLAAAGHVVCTNAGDHRMDPDVPLLIPEVNPDHLDLIDVQRRRRGWSGAIVANPNCTATPVTMTLRPLLDQFGIERVMAVSMQALSGAGYPGVPSYDAIDNVVPYIGGSEEEKLETEPQKMLGMLGDDTVIAAGFVTTAHCNRVPVLEGHLVCLSIAFTQRPEHAALDAALRHFRAAPQELQLPSAPAMPLVLRDEVDRPQPRRDRDAGNGMSTVIGRIRTCAVFDYKLTVLGHNTIRGAAGGSLLNAELMYARGLLT